MKVDIHRPTEKQIADTYDTVKVINLAKDISRRRVKIYGHTSTTKDTSFFIDPSSLSIDYCLRTITGCFSFEQIKAASNYCSLMIKRMYPFPKKLKNKVDLHRIEGQRESLAALFREKLLQKAKELTPYHSEIPDEELAEILWS